MSEVATTSQPYDGKQARENAEKLSRKADMKQHADKLIRGFEKLNNDTAKRAVWELIQNACDLSADGEAIVTIDYSNGGFSFTHNGKPFTSSTFISLIKQVSDKTDDESVGEFGTGFITTHSFGRKFTLNSCLKEQDTYIAVKDFLIDRSATASPDLAGALAEQETRVYKLLEDGSQVQPLVIETKFNYLPETDKQRDFIKLSAATISEYIPIVLTLSKKLKSVTVIKEDGTKCYYQLGESKPFNGINVTSITTESTPIDVFWLRDEDQCVTVILPFKTDKTANPENAQISKIFVYYPLIGTENWGCNFIIHADKFEPTEPRNGLHLNSDNEQLKSQEQANKDLIQCASQLIFDYVKANAGQIVDPINLAQINFNTISSDTLLNEYFEGLKNQWIEHFRDCQLVETANHQERITPAKAIFLHNELLQDPEAFESVYNLAGKFWPEVPKKNLAEQWTRLVDTWNISSTTLKSATDLAGAIQEQVKLERFSNTEDLKRLYEYFIKYGFSELFNTHALLPNIKGHFKHLVRLNKNVNIPEKLIQIADVLMPEKPQAHIHPDFSFGLEFRTYSRNDYSTDINDVIEKRILDKTASKDISVEFREQLIEFCKVVSTIESESVPNKITKLICEYYKQTADLTELPTITGDELNVKPAQRRLVRLCLNDVSLENSEWVKQSIDWLEQLIATGHDYTDYKTMFQTVKVFPNMLYELREQTYLTIDKADDEVKNLYDDVIKPNLPVRAGLVLSNFEQYLVKQDETTTNQLTTKLEAFFLSSGPYSDINKHPYKPEILKIVKSFGPASKWSDYFPAINGKKTEILVNVMTDDIIKEDVFTIVNLEPGKINQLGTLAKHENMARVISLGLEAVAKENQHQSTFEFLYDIGTRMEKNLRERLAASIPDDLKCTPNSVQDGQDIIVTIKGEPIYYIEVKSRWDVNSSVRLSRNQTLRAYAEKDNYALCSIDMTKYQGLDKFRLKTVEPVKDWVYFNTDIGSKVEHLINVLEHTNDMESIQLDGEYRTRVPMSYIETGKKLDVFEEYLIEHIKNYIASNAQPNQ